MGKLTDDGVVLARFGVGRDRNFLTATEYVESTDERVLCYLY